MSRFAFVVAFALLVGCRDRGVQPRNVVSADSADQVYDSMVFNITRDGVKTSRVEADSAWVYQARQVADLKNIKVTSFDSAGAVISTITAKTGIYGIRESSLDARGNVVATSSGGRVLKTEHLVFDRSRNMITSDTSFTSTSPQANLSGTSFESDPGFQHVHVTRPKGGSKKGFVLPGQGPGGAR
jgi:LPS export ABC transporter protein LptC